MADFCLSPGLMSYQDALKNVVSHVSVVDEVETVEVVEALGRVVAEQVCSQMNVPPSDNSAMDGFAFTHADALSNQPLNIVGKALAGQPFTDAVPANSACWIMTGAVVPKGVDTVVMQEHVRMDGENLYIDKVPSKGSCIRSAGEDISLGQVVFEPGHVIGPADIGVLASLGVLNIVVKRRLKVALIASGDELKKPGQTLDVGDIYETNATTLSVMLGRLPVDVIDFGIVADDKAALKQAFEEADQQADIVISSGGVSVGQADYTKVVLGELGKIDFWKVAIKPGKPFACGTLPNSVFFGLPGNPVSALVTFWQLALPAIKKALGMTDVYHAKFRAKTTQNFKKTVGRMDFQRGILSYDSIGNVNVSSTGAQGSGMLSSVVKANCFIQLEAERGNVNEGEWVWVQPFDYLLK